MLGPAPADGNTLDVREDGVEEDGEAAVMVGAPSRVAGRAEVPCAAAMALCRGTDRTS